MELPAYTSDTLIEMVSSEQVKRTIGLELKMDGCHIMSMNWIQSQKLHKLKSWRGVKNHDSDLSHDQFPLMLLRLPST